MHKRDRHRQKSTPDLVRSLVEMGSAHLLSQLGPLGLSEATANSLMVEIAHQLCQRYGGSEFYMPKDDFFVSDARDTQIWAAFDGTNHQALADHHHLSVKRIYQIIAAQRAKQRALTQHHLPGFEEA